MVLRPREEVVQRLDADHHRAPTQPGSRGSLMLPMWGDALDRPDYESQCEKCSAPALQAAETDGHVILGHFTDGETMTDEPV